MSDEYPVTINGKSYIFLPAVCVTADVCLQRECFLGVNLAIEGEGWGTGGPGISLDTYDRDLDRRVGTAYGCEFIRLVLTAFGVQSFREVTRRPVDVLYSKAGTCGNAMIGFRCRKMHGGSGEWMVFSEVIDPATGKPNRALAEM